MSEVGYAPGGEALWWQAVCQHLRNAEAAAVNAMSHNLDDQTEAFRVQDEIAAALQRARAICDKKGIPHE